jgi:hypothetical protein
LPVGKVETTRLGVARVSEAPGLVSYVADFAAAQSFEAPYSAFDLEIPAAEKRVIQEIAAQIKVRGTTNQFNQVRAVERYFAQNFTYSLYERRNETRDSAMTHFLKNTHKGHCEYFATATTLLLRELGIPARYAVGYALEEVKGDTYIVRERHAHAWVLAWFNGQWREVDTTPGTWATAEKEEASLLEPVSDFFSNLWFKFAMWRWLGQKGIISRIAPYLILPLVAILVWRIFFRKNRVKTGDAASEKFNWPGRDSEYYELEKRLAASGHERHPHETPTQFLQRLRRDGFDHPSLPALIDLHYRYRFDPRGIEQTDRKQLRTLASVDIAPTQNLTAAGADPARER